MGSFDIKKLIAAIAFIAGSVAIAVVAAPIGVPMASNTLFKTGANFKPLRAIITGGDPAGGLSQYMAQLFASEHGVPAFMLWLSFVVLIFGLLLLMQYFKKNEGRNVSGGILGDAKLITSMQELRKKNDFWNGKGTPEKAGLVIGNSKKGYLFDSSIPHWAITGKTGSGKSWLVYLQTLHLCMAAGWNLIVTGKNEMLELTGDKALKLGYHRVVFDLRGYPGASRFNPIDLIAEFAEAGNMGEAQLTARQTAADLVPIGGESNAYFPKAARDVLTACLLIVAFADIPRSQKNMATVCDMINRGTTGDGKDPSAPLKDFIRSSEVGPDHPAYAAAADFLSDGGMTTAGKNVLSTLKEALSVFNDEGIRRVTAASDVSIRDMVREKTVVYMHLMEEGAPYMVLMTAFMNQWWRIAQAEADMNGSRLPHETAILGDEWGNLPKVEAMAEIVTLGRSYHLHAYCATQDLKQWLKYNKPGDQNAGRDKILGSMGGKVALALANPDDCQYFTRLAGKRTVRTQNTGTSKQGWGVVATSGSSEAYTERADDLIHEWEWANRAPVKDGAIVIKGAENSKPGREGVFQMPVTYASNTPAGEFFGLGSEQECDIKRMQFRHNAKSQAAACKHDVEVWRVDLDACKSEQTARAEVVDDEWQAWDGM